MRNQYLFAGASCLALTFWGEAAAQNTPGQPPVAPAGQADPQSADPYVVVVTASRRDENIQDVPTAVTAFGEDKLRDTQIASLEDLTAITPNIQISKTLTNANISIRGIGNGNLLLAGGEPGVAVHRNGVYQGQPGMALSTFLDVQRVEVLRGPQGTLFGRNATGGAINIIPNGPTEYMSYGFDIAAGFDPTMARSSAFVSGPLNASAEVLGRLSIQQNYNEGFTENKSPAGPSRLDGRDDYSARGQLEWRPSDDFDMRLLAEYQKNSDSGAAVFLLGNPAGAPVVFPDPLAPITLPPGFPMGDPDAREAYANVGERETETKAVDLSARWTLGGGALTALLSYGENTSYAAQDGDGTAVPFTATYFTVKADQRYGEILYASDPDQVFTYILGANLFDEHVAQDNLIPTSGYTTLFPVYAAGGVIDTNSYGVFARAQYDLPAETRLFAGVRYSHDEKVMSEYLNLRPVFVPGAAPENAGEESWNNVSYEFGASHSFSRELTAYAKYATGYKSGGYSVSSFNPAFEPEKNTNTEVGLKGTFLEDALRANLAAFHMEYDNLQVNQVQGLVAAVDNAARATVDGFEVEAVLHATDSLRIEAAASWLDARFDEFTTEDSARPALGTLDLSGNTLPGAPRYSASIGVFNDFVVPTGTLTLGGRYDWKDDIHFSEFNIPISSQEAAGKLDLFLNYRSDDDRWTASLFALNVGDEQVRANVVVVSALLGSLGLAQYQPGRQIGVSLGYRY